MKISLLSLLLGAALIAIPCQTVRSDDDTSSDISSSSTTGDTHPRRGKILAELNLTDAQKQQIKQIWSTTTDRKERRRQIWQILTHEQRDKLKELRQEHKSGELS
jgi:Spy/CpxP family protein refolding chaperone